MQQLDRNESPHEQPNLAQAISATSSFIENVLEAITGGRHDSLSLDFCFERKGRDPEQQRQLQQQVFARVREPERPNQSAVAVQQRWLADEEAKLGEKPLRFCGSQHLSLASPRPEDAYINGVCPKSSLMDESIS